MEQYQLLPLVVSALSLVGGLGTGMQFNQRPWAGRLKPFAVVALLLAWAFGSFLSANLTGLLMLVIASHWTAALIAVALLAFVSGTLFAFALGPSKSTKQKSPEDS